MILKKVTSTLSKKEIVLQISVTNRFYKLILELKKIYCFFQINFEKKVLAVQKGFMNRFWKNKMTNLAGKVMNRFYKSIFETWVLIVQVDFTNWFFNLYLMFFGTHSVLNNFSLCSQIIWWWFHFNTSILKIDFEKK